MAVCASFVAHGFNKTPKPAKAPYWLAFPVSAIPI